MVAGVKNKLKETSTWNMKHFVLIDNLGVALAQSKGRCHSIVLLNVMRRLSALLLATQVALTCRWLPSECNAADGPSRRWVSSDNCAHRGGKYNLEAVDEQSFETGVDVPVAVAKEIESGDFAYYKKFSQGGPAAECAGISKNFSQGGPAAESRWSFEEEEVAPRGPF